MSVIGLTVFVGLILLGIFVLLWIATSRDSRNFSDRNALLPLEADATTTAPSSSKTHS